MSDRAFFPSGETLTIAGTTASAGGALSALDSNNVGPATIRVVNVGAGVAFIRTGVGVQTAVATDFPIPPNSAEVFRIPQGHTHAAVIMSAGSATVYITRGEGI